MSANKKKNPIRFREITPYVDVVIDSLAWRAVNPLPGVGWELQTKEKPVRARILTTEEYAELKDQNRVMLVSQVQAFAAMQSLTPIQRNNWTVRRLWNEVIDEALESGEESKLTRGSVDRIIESKLPLVVERWREYLAESGKDNSKPRRKKKFGSLAAGKSSPADIDSERLRPCGKTLQKRYERWVESGRDDWTLVPHNNAHREGGQTIDPLTWAVITDKAEMYASEKSATLAGIRDLINADIVTRNATLGVDHQIPLATIYGVGKAVAELPASVVLGGRLGKKRMVQELRHVGKGPQYKRVGEMTLHDCWSTHVFTLLSEAAQKLFDKKELEVRIVLAVVVEAASGAIIGIKHGLTESADLVQSALRMSVSDKSAIALAAGCTDPWDMRSGVEEVKSDAGKSYRSSLYMGSAYSIADRVTYTAAGRANLRGMIERAFRTIDEGFITKVTGRTGSHIRSRLRDELDPQKRASLFVNEFMKMIIRWIVDVYHFRPRNRVQLSAARKYQEIRSRIQCKAPPTDDEIRVAFGITVQRKLTRAGIRFMNIIYHSGWLDIIMAAHGAHDVIIKVDPENLGRISVLLGQDWTTIPGPRELDGVTLDEWIERNDELARQHGEQARLDFQTYIAPALLDIDRQTKEAEKFFELKVNWNRDSMDAIEKDLRVFALFDRDAEGEEIGLTQDSAKLGSVYTRSAPPALEASVPAFAPMLTTSTDDEEEILAPVKRNHGKKDRK